MTCEALFPIEDLLHLLQSFNTQPHNLPQRIVLLDRYRLPVSVVYVIFRQNSRLCIVLDLPDNVKDLCPDLLQLCFLSINSKTDISEGDMLKL